jgi:hypothetical protein
MAKQLATATTPSRLALAWRSRHDRRRTPGQEVQTLSFAGYILMRKPSSCASSCWSRSSAPGPRHGLRRPELQLPSPAERAIVAQHHHHPVQNGLENLRPDVFFDSLFIEGHDGDEIMSMTTDIASSIRSRRRRTSSRPAYALQILQLRGHSGPNAQSHLHQLHRPAPYQRDIYDKDGHVVTKAYYSNYQYYANTPYPRRSSSTPPRPLLPYRHHHQAHPQQQAGRRPV